MSLLVASAPAATGDYLVHVAALAAARARDAEQMDSRWTPLTTYLAAMSDHDDGSALTRQEPMTGMRIMAG